MSNCTCHTTGDSGCPEHEPLPRRYMCTECRELGCGSNGEPCGCDCRHDLPPHLAVAPAPDPNIDPHDPDAYPHDYVTAALRAGLKSGKSPRHDCRLDGHIGHVFTNRCVYCNVVLPG